MAAYIIAEVEITDPAAYEDYRKQAPGVIAAFGGRYLARGGAAELLEGQGEPKRLVILEFPSAAQLRSFYHSPDYQKLVAMRQRAATSRLVAVEGL